MGQQRTMQAQARLSTSRRRHAMPCHVHMRRTLFAVVAYMASYDCANALIAAEEGAYRLCSAPDMVCDFSSQAPKK